MAQPTTSTGIGTSFLHGVFGLQASGQSELSSLDQANEWINSPPLTAPALRGKVVLIDFWTYTCINWLRTLPYVRAWHEKYRDQGLVVIGVHAPEFSFEKNPDNVRWAVWWRSSGARKSGPTSVRGHSATQNVACQVASVRHAPHDFLFTFGKNRFAARIQHPHRFRVAQGIQQVPQLGAVCPHLAVVHAADAFGERLGGFGPREYSLRSATESFHYRRGIGGVHQ